MHESHQINSLICINMLTAFIYTIFLVQTNAKPDCAVMESELEKRKSIYNRMCSKKASSETSDQKSPQSSFNTASPQSSLKTTSTKSCKFYSS